MIIMIEIKWREGERNGGKFIVCIFSPPQLTSLSHFIYTDLLIQCHCRLFSHILYISNMESDTNEPNCAEWNLNSSSFDRKTIDIIIRARGVSWSPLGYLPSDDLFFPFGIICKANFSQRMYLFPVHVYCSIAANRLIYSNGEKCKKWTNVVVVVCKTINQLLVRHFISLIRSARKWTIKKKIRNAHESNWSHTVT